MATFLSLTHCFKLGSHSADPHVGQTEYMPEAACRREALSPLVQAVLLTTYLTRH